MKNLCFVTALPSEARPLVDHFKMKAMPHPHLKLFQGENGYLLQCGVGKLGACAATASMLQLLPNVQAIINVGIAGGEQPLNDVFLAHSILETATGKQWFPHMPPAAKLPGLPSIAVATVDQPSSEYNTKQIFDMEAAGIVSAAANVLDLAFVHSVKVISDNQQHGIDNINLHSVTESIELSLPHIHHLVEALPFNTLPDTQKIKQIRDELCDSIRHSSTEKSALLQLLQRYQTLHGKLPAAAQMVNQRSAKELHASLKADISSASLVY